MKIMSSTALLIAATLAQSNAGYAQESNGSDEGDAQELNAANTIVCRRYPPPTGSRIGARRICRTQAQWTRIDNEMRVAIERAQINRCATPPCSSGE